MQTKVRSFFHKTCPLPKNNWDWNWIRSTGKTWTSQGRVRGHGQKSVTVAREELPTMAIEELSRHGNKANSNNTTVQPEPVSKDTRPTVTTLPPQPELVSKDTKPTRPFEAGRLKKFVQKWEEIM